MKKAFYFLLLFTIALYGESKTSDSESSKFGWFFKIGGGATYWTTQELLPGGSAGLGMIFLNSENPSRKSFLSINFSAHSRKRKIKDRIYNNLEHEVDINGYTMELTLDYDTSYAMFSSDSYEIAILAGFGGGAQIVKSRVKSSLLEEAIEAQATIPFFSVNLGLRNVFAKHHAIDLGFRTLIRHRPPASIVFLDNYSLFLSYAFLSF